MYQGMPAKKKPNKNLAKKKKRWISNSQIQVQNKWIIKLHYKIMCWRFWSVMISTTDVGQFYPLLTTIILTSSNFLGSHIYSNFYLLFHLVSEYVYPRRYYTSITSWILDLQFVIENHHFITEVLPISTSYLMP